MRDRDSSRNTGATLLAANTGKQETPSAQGGRPGKPPGVVEVCRRVASAARFQNFILAVIVVNAAVIGLETSPQLRLSLGYWTDAFNLLAQTVFTIEIAIRLIAHWPRPLRFFRNGWNIFDFAVVSIAFIPATAGLSNLARLARVGRATRLISALPELRLVFETILRSIPSISHIMILLALFLYVYGIVGVNLFAATDPHHWGSLGQAILTLFQVLTLEGWDDVQRAVSDVHRWSWVYFTTFIVVAVWVVTNLFVAVIINNLQASKEAEAEQIDIRMRGQPLTRIAEIRQALSRLERDIRAAAQERREPNDGREDEP